MPKKTPARILRVRVEPSRVWRRVWLKAIEANGDLAGILNIPRARAEEARNALCERLAATGLYDQVIGEPIPNLKPVPRRKT